MSFKREGDDKSQLNILQKRRVADLLSHFIPEDEAALMNNGRYACVVCAYRPVFDTADTLTVHRNGKRHLEGLKAFYGKKARLKNERTRRLHDRDVAAEDTRRDPSCSAPLLAQTRRLARGALMRTVPYHSRRTETSTKSETGPLGAGSETGRNSSGKTGWEQEKGRRQSEADEGPRPPEDRTGAHGAATQEAEPITAERRSELEHYLKLKSDGWLKDRSGRWVRDRNVEFDSDEEEEPPSPAPPPPSRSPRNDEELKKLK